MIDEITAGTAGLRPVALSLSEPQKNKLEEVLSEHDPANLSVSDIDSIHAAFRELRIVPSEDLKTALQEKGFDAEAFAQRGRETPPPPPPPSDEELSALKAILESYDLNDLSAGDRDEIFEKAAELGFPTGAHLLNVSA